MTRLVKRIISLLVLLAPGLAMGQITFDGCVDFRGLPVGSIGNAAAPDVAMATYAPNGLPVIIYNPYILGWLSPQTRLFFYAHECAHHVLAHGVRSIPLTREQEADCWGIQQLTNMGLLNDADIGVVQQDLARAGQGDWTHLPGPIRAINLRLCLGGASSRQSNRSEGSSSGSCYGRCQAIADRCTMRCTAGPASEECNDRCERRFDACTDRCP